MATSRRCGVCNINWPMEEEYKTCFGCKGLTHYNHSEYPLTSEAAQSKRKHIVFERYYKERGPQEVVNFGRYGTEKDDMESVLEAADKAADHLKILKDIPMPA